MANFLLSVTYVLENEGGYVFDKADAGGCTNMGITLATLTTFRKVGCTIDDIKNITKEEATEIYYQLFYRPLRLMFVRSNNIATAIMDVAVNSGNRNSVIFAQRTLIKLLFDTGVAGKMDDTTIESLNKVDQAQFIDAFEVFVMRHYHDIVLRYPIDAKFLHGWSNRAGRLLTLK